MSDGIINVLFLKSHATFCGNLIMQATIHNTLLTADRVELQPKDQIKTANTIENQAKRKGLGSGDINVILDELDDNHEIILKNIFSFEN